MPSPIHIILIVILTEVVSCVVKGLYYWRVYGRLMFWGDGGMPSGHSASIAAVITGLYVFDGFSLLFVFGFCWGVCVIWDALNVRRQVGLQAAFLNKVYKRKVLKEDSGHTLYEVVVGVVIGVVVALVYTAILF